MVDNREKHIVMIGKGKAETHKHMLIRPPEGTIIYKVTEQRYFLDMIRKKYLYFNRVDTYKDDITDSDVTPEDKKIHKKIKLGSIPDKNVQDYYDTFRSRTYAACFTTRINKRINAEYGGDIPANQMCIVFDCARLIQALSDNHEKLRIRKGGKNYFNLFDINYGMVVYGDFEKERLSREYLTNPMKYIYFKDKKKYEHEKEFRVALTCCGVGDYDIGGEIFKFPKSIGLAFNVKKEIACGTIKQLMLPVNCNKEFISQLEELKVNIKTA